MSARLKQESRRYEIIAFSSIDFRYLARSGNLYLRELSVEGCVYGIVANGTPKKGPHLDHLCNIIMGLLL